MISTLRESEENGPFKSENQLPGHLEHAPIAIRAARPTPTSQLGTKIISWGLWRTIVIGQQILKQPSLMIQSQSKLTSFYSGDRKVIRTRFDQCQTTSKANTFENPACI
jgi:hypothetical protein